MFLTPISANALRRCLATVLCTALVALLFLLSACKSTKPMRPEEQYDAAERFEPQRSSLQIPIEINVPGLQRSLNRQFSGLLYEDKDFEDGDDMKVQARKNGDIGLSFTNSAVTYDIPLNITIQYKVGLGIIAEATAQLDMKLQTDYSIQPNWGLRTASRLVSHRWREKPRVRVGVMSIPVETIANLILRRSEQYIGRSIDAAVKEAFDLNAFVKEAWEQLFQPFQLSEEYQTWLLLNPQSIGMTPIQANEQFLRAGIVVQAMPQLKFGLAPQSPKPTPLPPFAFRQALNAGDDNFQIFLNAEMNYQDAERLSRQNLLGQRYENGKRYVVVEDIELYGQGNKLIINTLLSGSYRGNIYLSGVPRFDPSNNRVVLDNLDFTLDTKNALVRSAGWLLKGTLKNMIQENTDYLLEYNLQEVRTQMQEQLQDYEVAKGIRLQGSLSQLDLYNAYITHDGIQIAVLLKGQIKVLVDDLLSD